MLKITIPLLWYALRIELVRPARAELPRQRPQPALRLDQLSPHLLRDIGLHDR